MKRINQILRRLALREETLATKHLQALTALDTCTAAFNKADKEVNDTLKLRPEYSNEAWAGRKRAEDALNMAKSRVRILESGFDALQRREAWLKQIRKSRVTDTKVDFVALTRSRIVGKMKLPVDKRFKRSSRRKDQMTKQDAVGSLSARRISKTKQREITKKGQH